jgi:2-dehydro-3-deoxy-D-pentonate aldolase
MIKGIIPVLLTPMLENGEIDERGLENLVEFLLTKNIAGIWAMGSASEDIHISRGNRIKIINKIDATVKGKIPVIAGTGMTNINEIIHFSIEIEKCELAGIHVVFFDRELCESRMISEMIRLADDIKFPVWLYHNPWRGRLVTKKIITELRDHPNIHGIKVGGHDLTIMIRAIMLQTPEFQVIGAGGGQMFSMFALGAHAHTASDACVWPEEFNKLYAMLSKGDIEAAREQQFKMIKFTSQLPTKPDLDNGEKSAEEKFMLSIRDICREFVNPAYRLLYESEKQSILSALKSYPFEWAQ